MRTPLVILNVIHNRARTLLGVLAVAIAVVLMFMQTGFYNTAETSAQLIYDALDFDVLLRSPHYLNLVEAHGFPADCATRAKSIRGVTGVSSLRLATTLWSDLSGSHCPRAILVIGCDPSEPAFALDDVRRSLHLLKGGRNLLVDRMSRSEFGPADGKAFGDSDIGRKVELGGKRMTIAGCFTMGTGFSADGAVLVSEDGYRRVQPAVFDEEVTLGLVRLDRRANRDVVVRDIQTVLGDDVEVLDRLNVLQIESYYWLWHTPIGLIFFMGVLLGISIGSVLVYLILANDVMNRLAEYATLRAMGYHDFYLTSLVLRQAIVLAVVGFVPGCCAAAGLYYLAERFTNLRMDMSCLSTLWIFGLTLTMCGFSGLAAVQKLRSAEPAKLF